MNSATILPASLLCSFSLIHCMEITKKEPTTLEQQYEIARILLTEGAHPNLKNNAILLHDILKLNHKNPDFSLAATKLFYEHNLDINTQSLKGYTFLIEAVRKKNIPLMKYLLDNRADPN